MSLPILPKRVWPAGIQQASVPANDNSLRDEAMERPCLGVANDASGSDANGDLWIVGDTPAGAFATFEENDVALYQFESWYAWAPTDGLRLIVDDVPMIYVGGSTNEWQEDTSDGMANPMTTAGDMIVGGASGVPTRVGVGTDGQVWTVVSGTGAWAASSGGSGTPGGSDKQVQFNNSGAFGGEAGFEYDASTNILTVANITTSGRILTAASATGGSGFRLPHGAAPSSPTNGDVWTTTAGIYVRVNGATVGPLAAAGGGTDRSTVTALSISSGVVNIDCSLGDYFTLSLTANVTSITFSNLPASGKGASIAVQIRQDATGSRTVTLPSSFKATGGSDTAVQSAANAYTLLTLTSFDQGTRWAYAMQEVAA